VGLKCYSYDNATAESPIGLFKTEVINHRSSRKTLDEVEYATMIWIDWYNKAQLHGALGYVPPVECERALYEGKIRSGLTA
jgi:transposase InsO family protein